MPETSYDDFKKMEKGKTLSDFIMLYFKESNQPLTISDICDFIRDDGFLESEVVDSLKQLEKEGKIEARYSRFKRYYGIREE